MEESLFNRRQVLTGSVIAALGALWLLLALCPLGTAWMRLSRVPQGVPSRSLSMGLVSPSPHSSLDTARWHACRSWTRAREAAAQELESLEEWDPTANMDFRREDWLRRLMAGDPHSDLQRADSAATRAARLARTPQERFEAVLLLSCIDCDLGHHQAELDQARLLMRLAPHSVESLGVMQRAAGHNGLKLLVEKASAAIAALEEARKGR